MTNSSKTIRLESVENFDAKSPLRIFCGVLIFVALIVLEIFVVISITQMVELTSPQTGLLFAITTIVVFGLGFFVSIRLVRFPIQASYRVEVSENYVVYIDRDGQKFQLENSDLEEVKWWGVRLHMKSHGRIISLPVYYNVEGYRKMSGSQKAVAALSHQYRLIIKSRKLRVARIPRKTTPLLNRFIHSLEDWS